MRRKVKARGSGRARLSVFRSSKHIYAQLIDDVKGADLASASSLEKTAREDAKTGANIDAAKAVGKLHRRTRARKRASRTSCSTAAAIFITAASKRWPTPPVRAVSTSKITDPKGPQMAR